MMDHGTLIIRGTIGRSDNVDDDLFNVSIQLFVGRKGKLSGTVYAGLFGTDRELKSCKDFWMIYR